TTPEQLRAFARDDLAAYATVRLLGEQVVEARRTPRGYAVLTKSGEQLDCRALLLATGFRDTLPAIGGARELHGRLVVPCPYCDAWEVRDQPLAAFSHPDERGAAFAQVLAQWSGDIVLCANRRPTLDATRIASLATRGVR